MSQAPSTFLRLLASSGGFGRVASFCSSFPSGYDGDAIEEDWLGVPMFFGGIGREATETALRKMGFRLEFSQVIEEVEEDRATVAFLWVIARKPS